MKEEQQTEDPESRAPDSHSLTDAQIIEIRDYLLPSQGDSFDCIAFARAAVAAAALEEASRICDSVNNYDNPMTANDCADKIRALKSAARAAQQAPAQLREALQMFVSRVEENGDWDDGCFYYRGTSASELEEPLRLARASLQGDHS